MINLWDGTYEGACVMSLLVCGYWEASGMVGTVSLPPLMVCACACLCVCACARCLPRRPLVCMVCACGYGHTQEGEPAMGSPSMLGCWVVCASLLALGSLVLPPSLCVPPMSGYEEKLGRTLRGIEGRSRSSAAQSHSAPYDWGLCKLPTLR